MASQNPVPELKAVTCLLVFTLAICITGCESDKTPPAEVNSPAEDACAQINNAIIISEQEGKLLNTLRIITDQQAETIIGAYETKFVTGPALDPIGLPLNG